MRWINIRNKFLTQEPGDSCIAIAKFGATVVSESFGTAGRLSCICGVLCQRKLFMGVLSEVPWAEGRERLSLVFVFVTYFLLNVVSRLPQPTDHHIDLCI